MKQGAAKLVKYCNNQRAQEPPVVDYKHKIGFTEKRDDKSMKL